VAQQVSRQNEPHEVKEARLNALRLAQQHRIDNETSEAGSIEGHQTGPTTKTENPRRKAGSIGGRQTD